MKKRILSILLVLSMLLSPVCAEQVFAATEYTYNSFKYQYAAGGIQITKYTGINPDVEIPSEINGEKVTGIAKNAFSNPTFPVLSITIPDGVTNIDDKAFYVCDSLRSIRLPADLTHMVSFSSCYNLQSIEIPDGITSIGEYTLSGCSNLESIELPKNLKSIGANAFYMSGLTSLEIPDGVTSIGNSAFKYCTQLKNVKLPAGITNIADSTFQFCSSLENIELPQNIKSIGSSAFQSCSSLENIELPNGVTSIGNSAFQYCKQLKNVKLPVGITDIADSTFQNCSSLKNIEFPENLASIGSSAFEDCSSLENIELPDGVTSIGSSVFNECSQLKNMKLPEGITDIPDLAFAGCSSLENIELPKNLKSIGASVFSRCDSLESIQIPESITSINSSALKFCNKLTDVYYAGSKSQWDKLNISSSDANNATIHYTADADGTGGRFIYHVLSDGTIEITEYTGTGAGLVIPSKIDGIQVSSIGFAVFSDCSGLESIEIPDGVTNIGNIAFSHCSNLKRIELPAGLASIGADAFSTCDKLTDVYYAGSKSQWEKIEIGDGNECLTNAAIHFAITTPPIQITTQPKSQTVQEGDEVVFGVSVSGGTPDNYTYRWYYSATAAGEGEWIENVTASGLKIPSADARYEGYYYCIISDGEYSVTSNRAKLTVIPAGGSGGSGDTTQPIQITYQPKSQTVQEGDEVIFGVIASGGTPDNYTYRWYYSATAAGEGEWIENVTASGLKIPSADASYEGYYYCIISDGEYSVTSDRARLIVNPRTGTETPGGGTPGGGTPGGGTPGGGTPGGGTPGGGTPDGGTSGGGTPGTSTSDMQTPDPSTLPVPKLTVKLTSVNAVKLSWSKVNGATKYYIYRRIKGDKDYILIQTVTGTTCTDKKLKKGKTYEYFVDAYDDFGKMISSKAVSKKIIGKLSTPKQKKIVEKKSKKKFTISWNSVKNAQKMEIWRSYNGGKYKKWKTVSAKKGKATYSYSGFKKGTYTFKIRAYYKADGKTFYSSFSSKKYKIKKK